MKETWIRVPVESYFYFKIILKYLFHFNFPFKFAAFGHVLVKFFLPDSPQMTGKAVPALANEYLKSIKLQIKIYKILSDSEL